MIYQVILQPRAVRDIEAHTQWIFEQSRSWAPALRWTRGIRAKIATLKTSPQRCPVDPDSEAYGEEVRVLLYGKRYGRFRALFAIRGDVVYVVTVRHSAQRSLREEMAGDDADEEDDGPVH